MNEELVKNFSHVHWIKKIGEYIYEDDPNNIIKFSLAYTLQSLRAGEDIDRFKWDEEI